MRHEYEAVAKAGIVLQIDCPDLAWAGTSNMPTSTSPSSASAPRMHVEALNHALANIPPEQLRIHLCWGNYEGPHHCDVPLADIIDIVFLAGRTPSRSKRPTPATRTNGALFERVKLPDGKVLIPGVIESKSNFIEHPELIAQRIGALRQAGRPGERDRRQRLRLRHLGRPGCRRPGRGVGEVRGNGRGRPHRHEAILEVGFTRVHTRACS